MNDSIPTITPPQSASSEVIRDINRRIVLNLIRTKQPISRADLARASGMQRSTISLIVEELVKAGWLIEGPTVPLPRGRRPTYLRLNEERAIIGIDIRPIQTTIALADVNGKFTSQEVMPTPRDPGEAIDEMIACIRRILGSSNGRTMEGIGISVPGRYDTASERLVFAPNLKWPAIDLRTRIADEMRMDVEIENAANSCVLASVWFDGMESFRNLVVITVSEGIGAGILMNGQLARGLSSMAGEFGHVTLDPDGPVCSCGSRGCWEVFASNRAGLRYYRELGGEGSAGLSFQGLLSLAEAGDAKAAEAVEKMAHYLGHGMRMIVAGLAPDRIVVIGELTRCWQRFGPVLEREVKTQSLIDEATPMIVPVHEDGMARLRGTVALVLQKHFHLA